MSGDPDLYPDKDEFADYLKAYATRFRLPLRHDATVLSVTRKDGKQFVVSGTGFDPVTAAAVVVATGAFRDPIVPSWASELPPEVRALSAEVFGDGNDLPPGPLLVVGDGASGRDIAMLARPKRDVVLATGRSRRLLPERMLGRSLWWWLDVTGLVRAPTKSLRGQPMRRPIHFLTAVAGLASWLLPGFRSSREQRASAPAQSVSRMGHRCCPLQWSGRLAIGRIGHFSILETHWGKMILCFMTTVSPP